MENLNETTAVVKATDDTGNELVLFGRAVKPMFCSMVAKTDTEKAQLFSVMNNPEYRLADEVNEVITMKDVFAEIVSITDKKTGEIVDVPRIVIIDENNKGHQCVSKGIFSAIQKIFMIYGVPTYNVPLKLKVTGINKDTNRILTLSVVQDAKK